MSSERTAAMAPGAWAELEALRSEEQSWSCTRIDGSENIPGADQIKGYPITLGVPARRSFIAIFAAGAVGAYIGGGFGVGELIYPVLATPVVYLGLRSYRTIGVAWLMHASWDMPHQLTGHPIWPNVRTSFLGCLIFDSLIAVWFLLGAPSIIHARRADAPA